MPLSRLWSRPGGFHLAFEGFYHAGDFFFVEIDLAGGVDHVLAVAQSLARPSSAALVMVLPASQISSLFVYGDILPGMTARYRGRLENYPNRELHG